MYQGPQNACRKGVARQEDGLSFVAPDAEGVEVIKPEGSTDAHNEQEKPATILAERAVPETLYCGHLCLALSDLLEKQNHLRVAHVLAAFERKVL